MSFKNTAIGGGAGPTIMSYVPAVFLSTRRGCALSATGPDVEATVGENVVAFSDLSGNNRRPVQATAANQPILVNSVALSGWSATSNLTIASGGGGDALDPVGSAVGLSIWVYPTSNNPASSLSIYGKFSPTGNQRTIGIYQVSGTNKCVLFVSKNGSTTLTVATSSNSMTINAWNHVAASYNPSTGAGSIVVNGTTTSGTVASGNLYSSAIAFSMGYFAGSSAFVGKLAQATYRKGAIFSDAEILRLYNSGGGLAYSSFDSGLKTNLVECWQNDNAFGFGAHAGLHMTENGTGLTGGQGPFATLDRNYLFFDGTNDCLVYDGSAGQSFLTTANATIALRGILMNPGTNTRVLAVKKHNLADLTNACCQVFYSTNSTTPAHGRNSVNDTFPGSPIKTPAVYGMTTTASALTLYSDLTSGAGTTNATALDCNAIIVGAGASGTNLTPTNHMRCLISDLVIYTDAKTQQQAENIIIKFNGAQVQ